MAILGLVGAVTAFVLAQPPAAVAPKNDPVVDGILDAYAKAFNEKKIDDLAAMWAEAGDYIDVDGVSTKGRTKVVTLFKRVFDENPKATMTLSVVSSKRVGADVLLIDGVAEIKSDGDSEISRFESIWQKSGDRWQASRVRELPALTATGNSNYEFLKELEWLVGEWTSEMAPFTVTLNAKWGMNKNLLLVEQTVKAEGKDAVTVMKVIGWDPSRGQHRTWVFDSDGGFGGAMMTRSGNTWIEESESLTRMAGEASALHTTTFVNDSQFEWTSTERQLDGRPLPELKLTYKRKSSK